MIHFSNISKNAGSKILYKNSSFQINAGEKVGLVGANGAGKSTLFKIITGEEKPDSGSISKPDSLVIGYFSQSIEDMKSRTALEEVKAINERVVELQLKMKELEAKLCEPLEDDEMQSVLSKYGDLQTEFEQMGGYDLEHRAQENLTGLGIPPSDHQLPADSFSGGWKMRIKLAKILTLSPDLLLMDEPTNHLDLESIEWLESWLSTFKGGLFLTTHDRDFMNRLTNKIVEVANKQITTYSGNYDFYEKERDIRKEQLIATAKRQEDMLAKEKEFIAKFAARASHAAQVQSRVKKLEKIDIIEIPPEEQTINFEWPTPPRGGDRVVEFDNLSKIWKKATGDDHLVFEKASALVQRQDKIAVVGVNGAGKSTLLKILTGQTEPSSGTYSIGPSIELGYFSQNSLDLLDPQSTVLEEVQSRLPTVANGVVRNLLGAFKFSGDDVDKKISILSGGEKSRVILACLLIKPINFLVLDEPTNHLDIASREVLLNALVKFEGTVMMVSHDRHFLRELTNKVFLVDKQNLKIVDGNWDYYLSKKEGLLDN